MSEQQTDDAFDAAETKEVRSAFVVFIDTDGTPYATNGVRDIILDVQGRPVLLEPEGQTSMEEMQRAAAEVVDDIRRARDTQAIVTNVMHNMAALGQQVAAAQQGKTSSGLVVPGAAPAAP